MHGSIMLFLFIGPFAFGLANYLVPLQIGARDMAFPRLNALGYWFYLFGGLTMLAGFLTADGAADFGWTGYAPLSDDIRSPGVGGDLWLHGHRAHRPVGRAHRGQHRRHRAQRCGRPGMSMFRMPIFTWNMLVTSVLVLIAFPVLTAAALMLFADRHLGAHIFDADAAAASRSCGSTCSGSSATPRCTSLALPFFGVITEVLPVFSRRPVFGYKGLVLATLAIAALSVGVWAHHMFTTGAVELGRSSAGSRILIAVPTGVKFFNWIGTMWGGPHHVPDADAVRRRVPAACSCSAG